MSYRGPHDTEVLLFDLILFCSLLDHSHHTEGYLQPCLSSYLVQFFSISNYINHRYHLNVL